MAAELGMILSRSGAPLPGEVALSQRHGTSRPTVRRAISELAGEGLINAAHGRGTYVRPRPERRIIAIGTDEHPDLFDDESAAEHYGWQPTQHPISARFQATTPGADRAIITAATREQAEALMIKTGQLVLYRFEHWRHRHTQRVISVTSITQFDPESGLGPTRHREPTDYQPTEEDYNTTIYAVLETGHGAGTFTTTVTARMPRNHELDELGIEPGTPLLQIRRTLTDTHGRPLELTMIEAASDRFEAATDTQPGDPGTIMTL
jgi:DNA-binding GntR family transcriptional regulator